MSVKKQGAYTDQKGVDPEAASRYLSDVKSEFHKITWTSKEELKVYTKVVLASTLVVGMGIFVGDLLIQGALDGIATLSRLITG